MLVRMSSHTSNVRPPSLYLGLPRSYEIVRALPLLSFPGQVAVLASHHLTRVKVLSSFQYMQNCPTVLRRSWSRCHLLHTIGPGGTLNRDTMTGLTLGRLEIA